MAFHKACETIFFANKLGENGMNVSRNLEDKRKMPIILATNRGRGKYLCLAKYHR